MSAILWFGFGFLVGALVMIWNCDFPGDPYPDDNPMYDQPSRLAALKFALTGRVEK